jgi:predicted transcriptional regulator
VLGRIVNAVVGFFSLQTFNDTERRYLIKEDANVVSAKRNLLVPFLGQVSFEPYAAMNTLRKYYDVKQTVIVDMRAASQISPDVISKYNVIKKGDDGPEVLSTYMNSIKTRLMACMPTTGTKTSEVLQHTAMFLYNNMVAASLRDYAMGSTLSRPIN